MKNNSYSFNKRLENISRIFLSIVVVVTVFGTLLILGVYDQSIYLWVTKNSSDNSSTGVSNSIVPIPQTITNIPYGGILIDNLISIIIIPFIFISFSLFIVRKASKKIITNEIIQLYKSIGISPSQNLEGTANIGLHEKITITGSIEGLFQITKNNGPITTITGDELYWKIKYLKYLNEN